VEYWWW